MPIPEAYVAVAARDVRCRLWQLASSQCKSTVTEAYGMGIVRLDSAHAVVGWQKVQTDRQLHVSQPYTALSTPLQ